jgi:hypothetical protein
VRAGAVAFDLETAAVLTAARRDAVAAAGWWPFDGAGLAPERPAHAALAERLGPAALAALSP